MIFEQPLSIDENSMVDSAWPAMPTGLLIVSDLFFGNKCLYGFSCKHFEYYSIIIINYIQGLCSTQTNNLIEIPFLGKKYYILSHCVQPTMF